MSPVLEVIGCSAMGIKSCARGCWVMCFGYCLLCYRYLVLLEVIGCGAMESWVWF